MKKLLVLAVASVISIGMATTTAADEIDEIIEEEVVYRAVPEFLLNTELSNKEIVAIIVNARKYLTKYYLAPEEVRYYMEKIGEKLVDAGADEDEALKMVNELKNSFDAQGLSVVDISETMDELEDELDDQVAEEIVKLLLAEVEDFAI
ncbi:hypothetical protein [Candidatus Epulonipiscium viviparus]|uniref:hypothetical protein n=1 Tax=Candidatus Epulonipiscium viviparus TaxID=420336 RepID=UPI0027380A6F|nr:hypothetical protein [Candidatus Epulopiscium viviparus]